LPRWFFFLTYTHIFLIDKSNHNNHYYFICLLGFLFCFVNTHRWMSLDALWNRKFRSAPHIGTVPYWNILLLKAQVFIVYFYGGLAKINGDWLRGEPFRHWLKEPAGREGTPALVARFMESEFGVYFFSYGGLIFDLAIGFLLICRKTRLLAFGLILIFNLTNNWLFSIGVFPVLMIAATILFLEPDTPRKFIKKLFPAHKDIKIEPVESAIRFRKPALIFFSLYLIAQILLPFRHWLYEGNVSWTEEGHNFSWHMKLRGKYPCRIGFFATDPESMETWPIPVVDKINRTQLRKMCRRPHMIIQYARYLGRELEKAGIQNPIIKVKSSVSLNYRPSQKMIDPDVNLVEQEYSTFRHAEWILPLQERTE